MFNQLDVVPAYGRDYNSEDYVRRDWNNNKDFRIVEGSYINKQQTKELIANGVTELNVRYSKLRKKLIIKLVV
jgi:hypothetical protein